jgi:hypothetical protein
MKNIFKLTYITLLTVFVGLVGCDDTSDTFTVTDNPTAPVLQSLSITDIQLDPVNTTTPAVTLNWQDADYGQQASVVYNIEFANDENFTNPIIASSVTGENAITFSMAELNSAAGNAGLNPFEWANLYARIVSSLGTQNGVPTTSNTISMNVYPYFNYVFSDYYLVGDGTSPGWDNNNNNPALFRDANDENLFTYTGYFSNGQFKVLETKGLWQPQWGTNDGSSIEVNPGGGSDPERFPTAGAANITPGFYTFTINFASKTFSFEAFDASGSTSPMTLSVQGSSLDSATPLSALTFDGHIWYASSVRLKPGDLQFATDSGALWGSDTSFSGVATNGGASIPVIVEDDYDIWFNDLTGQYILIPLNL